MKEEEENTMKLTRTDWIITTILLLGLFVPVFFRQYSFWFPVILVVVVLAWGVFLNWWKDYRKRKDNRVGR